MTSLEDLVRETLAERAHDVDRVGLNAAPAPPRTRRWVAIAAAVLAPALLVGLVAFVPWRDQHDLGPTTTAELTEPPAGMQWVSYHGITLTVPATWELNPAGFCSPPPDSVVVSTGNDTSVSVGASCPARSRATRHQITTTVQLRDLGGEGMAGSRIEVGGHPAYRDDGAVGPGVAAYTWPVETLIRLPDVGVAMEVRTQSENDLQRLLRDVEYTPVDHLGCSAHLSSGAEPVPPSATISVPTARSVTVCEYELSYDHADLLGSRTLTDAEVAELRSLVDSAHPFDPPHMPLGVEPGPDMGVHVYRVERSNGSISTITADPRRGSITVSDGEHIALVPPVAGVTAVLPGAYPG